MFQLDVETTLARSDAGVPNATPEVPERRRTSDVLTDARIGRIAACRADRARAQRESTGYQTRAMGMLQRLGRNAGAEVTGSSEPESSGRGVSNIMPPDDPLARTPKPLFCTSLGGATRAPKRPPEGRFALFAVRFRAIPLATVDRGSRECATSGQPAPPAPGRRSPRTDFGAIGQSTLANPAASACASVSK